MSAVIGAGVIALGTLLALAAVAALVAAYLAALLWMVEQCELDRETAWG